MTHSNGARRGGGRGRRPLYCSFCGKAEHEVVQLIAGPDAFICNECVDSCVTIIRDQALARGAAAVRIVDPHKEGTVR